MGVRDIWDRAASKLRAGFPFDPGEGTTCPPGKCDLLPIGMLEKGSKEGRLEGGENNKDATHAPEVSSVLPGLSSALVRRMWNEHTRR